MEKDEDIHSLDKCYEFTGSWALPTSLTTVTHNIEKLQIIKNQLNIAKSKVRCFPNKIWHQHTKNNHPGFHIMKAIKQYIKPSFCSQAWCKLLEIIQKYDLLPSKGEFFSLHLCEAPGAFITVIHHLLNHKSVLWKWKASTLNPYSEGSDVNAVIQDDRIIRSTHYNWLYGVDNTGDFLSKENVFDIMAKATEDGDMHLVTADGSISCYSEPARQELMVVNLIFHEVVAALCVLTAGGNFVVKMFTFFEIQTVSILYLLNCCFEKVAVFKPLTSKGGNSEVYVVCLKFFPHTGFRSLFHKYFLTTDGIHFKFAASDLPADFIAQTIACSQYFHMQQCATIDFNISTFKKEFECNINVAHLVAVYLGKYSIFPTEIPFPGLYQVSIAKRCRDKEYAHLLTTAALHAKKSKKQGHMLSNILTDSCRSLTVQGSQEPPTFQLVWGKQIQYSSSVFCSQSILQILLNLSWQLKSPIPSQILNNKSSEVIIAFKVLVQELETNQVKCEFLKNCIKALNHMKKNVLVLVGLPLLSRFYLGIIWLLLQASFSMEISPALGNNEAKVTFRLNSELVPQIMAILKTICHRLTQCCTKEGTLLEIVPTPVLLDYNFLEVFFCYNDHVLVHNIVLIEETVHCTL